MVSPTEGGAAGALLATLIGVVQRKLTSRASSTLQGRHGTTAQLFFVGIGAVLYTKFLALSGTADMFTELVGTWALDPLLLVIAVSIVYIILGMFLDPLGMILLTIPVFVPMFAALNLDLVWFGVLVVKYIGISLLTPPVGFNIYVVATAHRQSDPAHDDLSRLLLVPRLRGRHHDAADRVSADLAVAAEPDEMKGRPGKTMKRSTDRILVTHVGSLVRPMSIRNILSARDHGEPYDEAAYEKTLREEVAGVVRKQARRGIDIVSDGEYGKAGWIRYVSERLGGFDHRQFRPATVSRIRST